jgi:hypothetical protein
VDLGIDSISLNPDAVHKTTLDMLKMETKETPKAAAVREVSPNHHPRRDQAVDTLGWLQSTP